MKDRQFFHQLGKTAATAYLNQQIPLNKSLIKISQEHQLNNNQVKRVCEFANHIVTASLYKNAQKNGSGDCYIEFPLADAGEIMREVSKPAVKAASAGPDDYDLNVLPGKTPDIVLPVLEEYLYVSKAAAASTATTNQVKLARAIHQACGARDAFLRRAEFAALKIANTGEELYRMIVNALKGGKLLEEIRESLAATIGKAPGEFEGFWKSVEGRLQADGLLDRPAKNTDVILKEETVFGDGDLDMLSKAAALTDQLIRRNKYYNAAITANTEADKLAAALKKEAVSGTIANIAYKGLKGGVGLLGKKLIDAGTFVKKNPGKAFGTAFSVQGVAGEAAKPKIKYL